MFELIVFLFVLNVIVAVAVANEAKKGGRSWSNWFAIVFLFGILGVAAYMYAVSIGLPTAKRFEVTGEVVDRDTGAKTTVALETSADARATAVDRFKAQCMDEGYTVEADSIGVDTTEPTTSVTRDVESRYRPGKNQLPPRIRSWYVSSPWEVVLFTLTVLSAVSLLLLLFVLEIVLSSI